MGETITEGLELEVATVEKDPYSLAFNGLLRPNDDTLASRGGAKGLKIYDEIERDCHAFSVLQKRKLALIARPVLVEPASTSLRDRKAAQLVESQLKQINFDQVCSELLDALLKGYSTAEIIWVLESDGIKVGKIKAKDQRRFRFNTNDELVLLTRGNSFQGEPLPERKFIVHQFGAKDGNPYGLGLGTRLFWPVWFKRQGIQFWLTFCDKFGSPTAVGKYPNGAGKVDRETLLGAIAALANDAGVIIPEGMAIEFLEAARSGSIDTYESLCRYMDEEISKAVLGETLSTTMGKSGGSYAASNTHNDVRRELTKADADLLSDTLNASLVKWIVELNMPGATPPRVVRDCREPEDSKSRSERDKNVYDMGFKPSAKYVQDNYGEGWEIRTTGSPADNGVPSDGAPAFAESAPRAVAATTDQDELVAGANQLATQYQALIGPRLDALLSLLEETNDLALFRERLAELLADAATEGMVGAVGDARFSAQLLGMLRGQGQ